MATKRQYHDSSPDGYLQIYKTGAFDRQASQSFLTGSTYDISSVFLRVYRLDLPGTMTVSIREASGDEPTGGDLVSGTFNGNTVTLDSSGEWIEITFGTPYSLSASTKYTIVMRNAGVDGGPTAVIRWLAVDGSSSYPDGQAKYSFDGGSSWSSSSRDFNFETWGSDPSRQIDTPTPSDTDTGIVLVPLLQWKIDGTFETVDGDLFAIYLKAGDSNFGGDDLLQSGRTSLDIQILWGLSYNTLYYWQVLATSTAEDLLDSAIWTFTTMPFLPPTPSVDGSGNPTGESNMMTIKRLIAAARNRIYYEDL